jgi:hypothetical protein
VVLDTTATHEESVPLGGHLHAPARSVVVLTDAAG